MKDSSHHLRKIQKKVLQEVHRRLSKRGRPTEEKEETGHHERPRGYLKHGGMSVKGTVSS